MRISQFVIGFVVISMFVVGFTYFLIDMNDNYTGVSVNESQLVSYDKIEEINALSEDMNRSLNNIQSNKPADVVGGLLESGFTVIKTTETSFDVYTDVTDEAIDNANLGQSSNNFKTGFLLIGILLFMFALVGILTGRVI